jgi:hypothetical protein
MLLFNLKDKNNPDLRRRVILGEIAVEELVQLSSEELASDSKRQENSNIRCAPFPCIVFYFFAAFMYVRLLFVRSLSESMLVDALWLT